MIDKTIGFRIRKQRELLGYTREELAEHLNVSPKFCSDLEHGVKGMSVETLCKLSKTLMVTTDYLLFGKNDPNVEEELINLIDFCAEEKRSYLKGIIQNFIRACE